MIDCIFCKIVKGEVPSVKVWEDDSYLAFLNIRPFKEGHTLIIPKDHTDYVFDLPKDKLSDLMEASRNVAALLKDAFKPQTGKIGVVVAGDEVPHVHIHLIPFDKASDLSFASAHSVSQEELQKTLKKLTPGG